jgi:hypothetical protein
LNIKEYIDLRKEDPSMPMKQCPVPGITKALKQGAKLDWENKDWDGATLFLKAVRSDSMGLAEYLLAVGADPMVSDYSGRNAFHWAAMGGNPKFVEFLITVIAEHDTLVQAADSGGDTPLHLASYYGHLPIVRLLTHSKVDTMQENEGGFTAHDLAEARRMWHISHYLSEKKQQKEDRETDEFDVAKLVRPCNLTRASELQGIKKALPKPKPKAKAKAKK